MKDWVKEDGQCKEYHIPENKTAPNLHNSERGRPQFQREPATYVLVIREQKNPWRLSTRGGAKKLAKTGRSPGPDLNLDHLRGFRKSIF